MRVSAHSGLFLQQLTVALILLIFSLPVIAQEEPAISEKFLLRDEIVDLAEQNDDTPQFVVPPDPKEPYLDAIDRFEEDYGPYAFELSDLYLGLGEVLLNEGEYREARDAYHRGVLVVRVNSGPNSPEQTNLLYMIANIETLLDEPKEADKIMENIRFINTQYYGENSAELYPVLDRVYLWYQNTRPLDVDESDYSDYRNIIDLTEDMVDIHAENNALDAEQAAIAYRRLAEAHFQAMRFAMAEEEFTDPDIVLAANTTYYATGFEEVSMREHYVDGREAFKTYIEMIRTNPEKTTLDYVEAMADLADWSLHFEKNRAARELYEQAYLELANSEDYSGRVEEVLGEPRPMEFTGFDWTPKDGEPMEEGSIMLDVSMTVTRAGAVRYVEVLNPPENLSEDEIGDIRRTVRETPFRPSVKDGKPISTKEFIWQHVYYPEPEENLADEDLTDEDLTS